MAIRREEVFERARLARDARYDGCFYIGVVSTGIYCRPICPANPPKRENVRYFPTAAAASEAGYRPCLRCRPEAAPGSPAWLGTSTTVRRGLRMIAHGVLDDGGVEGLAARLGVTGRHLRRLFNDHVGASPLAVAHTQRLHFAKRLIDETRLPMGEVAIAAGYGSVRRFNDAFRRAYGRSPGELRRCGNAADGDAGSELTLRLPYRSPFDWPAMLDFFRRRATPGVEAVIDNRRYLRTVALDGCHGLLAVAPATRDGFLEVRLSGIGVNRLFDVVQSVRDVFDLDAPIEEIGATLGRDGALSRHLKHAPGVRLIGAWDGFEFAVRAILGQQVSVAAATTLAGRIAARYGEPLNRELADAGTGLGFVFPGPAKLARAHFNNMGLIGSRIAAIRSVARAVQRGDLDFDPGQDVDEFRARFRAIKGIGDWTVEYVCMRVLKHPDAFPASDLGLLKAIEPGRRLAPRELRRRAEAWRPWRAYAAALLWSAAADGGG